MKGDGYDLYEQSKAQVIRSFLSKRESTDKPRKTGLNTNKEGSVRKINETANKIFVPLKMIFKDAAMEYGWRITYNPFFGISKLSEADACETISPFTPEDQKDLIDALPEHWKPYFAAAFKIGSWQVEQNVIKPNDIDWLNDMLMLDGP